ncbi:hypothetical protein IFM89_040009, partial [Coptis chinensis]
MSIPDLEFIPDESEEDELHRLHLQIESMWKINKFPDEINLDSINDKELKSWNSKSKITIIFLSKGLFKFSFEDEQELRFVLENGPWSVHGSTWENIHKIGSAFGLVVVIDSIGGSDAGNSFSRVQVMYPIRRRMISSAQFGIGVQSRKVLEWDPKEELLRKSVPMEFKMQDYNRKGKQTIDVDLSSEVRSRFSHEIQVGKLMVTEEGGLPPK